MPTDKRIKNLTRFARRLSAKINHSTPYSGDHGIMYDPRLATPTKCTESANVQQTPGKGAKWWQARWGHEGKVPAKSW